MEKDNFFKNSFLLTASNVTTGLLGFIFSILLSNLLSPEGVGLYNIVMPIYNLFICLMTAGIVAAISKVAAVYSEKGDRNNLVKTISTVAGFNIVWSLIVGIGVYFLAPYIGEHFVRDLRVVDAIKITCPAMIFISLSNILKGYFLGTSKITMPAFIDILEKAMRIGTIILLIGVFKPPTISGLVTLAYLSLCIGELQSLLLLYLYYKFCIKRVVNNPKKLERRSQLLFDVLVISLPLCLNGFLTSALAALATLIVPRRLIVAGYHYTEALGLIGKYTGMAMTLIIIPMIVVNSINSLLIPDLSQTLSKNKYYEASVRIKKVMKIAFLLGIGTTIICNLIPNSLGEIFFGRGDLGLYVRLASFTAPMFFTANTMFGVLNGLNKQGIILRNSLILAVVEIITLYIFTAIPNINIFSYTISLGLTSIIGLGLNLYEVKKRIDLEINIYDVIIYLLLGVLTYIVLNIIVTRFLAPLTLMDSLIVVALTFGAFFFWGRFGEKE